MGGARTDARHAVLVVEDYMPPLARFAYASLLFLQRCRCCGGLGLSLFMAGWGGHEASSPDREGCYQVGTTLRSRRGAAAGKTNLVRRPSSPLRPVLAASMAKRTYFFPLPPWPSLPSGSRGTGDLHGARCLFE